MHNSEQLLELDKLNASYGAVQVLYGASLAVARGDVVCLVGRNGVGKSTTLKSVMGIVRTRSGTIKLLGKNISDWKTYEIARVGAGYVPEERRIFGNLSVYENLLMGVTKKRLHDCEGQWNIDGVYEIFPRLRERRKVKGSNLSGGEQQMLSIARALMGNPQLILVDEPTEGLAPVIVNQVIEMLKRVAAAGVSILLAESKISVARRLASRSYIMFKGEVVFEGSMEELENRRDIREKYLEV